MSKINKINKEIQELYRLKEKIQKECNHPKSAREEKYGSNTGNYDPSSDSYWIDYYCTLCEKRWSEDQ